MGETEQGLGAVTRQCPVPESVADLTLAKIKNGEDCRLCLMRQNQSESRLPNLTDGGSPPFGYLLSVVEPNKGI